jgi:FdhE protein
VNPEWGAVLAALREIGALFEEARERVTLRLDWGTEPRRPEAPLLNAAVVEVDAPWFHTALLRVARAASSVPEKARLRGTWERALAGVAKEGFPLLPVLQAVIQEDTLSLAAIGRGTRLGRRELGVVARLAALPVLGACAQQCAAELPASWTQGYCPVCAAWPLLAEVRGVEQARRLRCGRCGADWAGQWLRCSFCGEGDHTRLGSLRPADGLPDWSVEFCRQGHYLKSHHALTPAPLFDLLLDDLETVELDLAARARGLSRDAGFRFPLQTEVEART